MHTRKIRGGVESADYQLCLKIRRMVFIEEQKVPEEIEIDEFEKFCDHFLTFDEGCPVSTGRLRVKEEFIKFERIATIKEVRGRGFGKALMLSMMKEARLSYPNLSAVMHSQLEASAFYKKLGWKQDGDIFSEAGIPHIRMIYE